MSFHVKTLFKHHLTVWSNLLLESALQPDPARWLLVNRARTTAFYLEAMTRVLMTMHNKKTMQKINLYFKSTEDALGEMDYYSGVLDQIKSNRQIPVRVKTRLKQQYDEAAHRFNALLAQQGWIGNQPIRMDKIKKSLKKVDWLNDNVFKQKLQDFYHASIERRLAQLSQPIHEIEADIHELRRDVRWLSIYPAAFKGFVALKPNRSMAQKWRKYCTDTILNSPYNQFVHVDDITDVVKLNAYHFYAMSWLIDALGQLKDQGLLLLAVSQAWSSVDSLEPATAKKQTLKALGRHQASDEEILSAAKIIVAQVKKDLVFDGLLAA